MEGGKEGVGREKERGREGERRGVVVGRMEVALQPSLLASLCWRQRDEGSAMIGKRVGGRGSS